MLEKSIAAVNLNSTVTSISVYVYGMLFKAILNANKLVPSIWIKIASFVVKEGAARTPWWRWWRWRR